MNGEENQKNMVDTTDCLEAVGVFRGWKNFLFIIIICCLVLLQVSFWLVNTNLVKAEELAEAKAVETAIPASPEVAPTPKVTHPDAKDLAVPPEEKQTRQSPEVSSKIEKAAEQVVAKPEEPAAKLGQSNVAETATGEKLKQETETAFFNITTQQLSWLIRFLNFILILAAVLYCLTMLFTLKVSMLGSIGGINHISRAFFFSVLVLVFLLPWQKCFQDIVAGVMFTPEELLHACQAVKSCDIVGTVLFYLRFVGYWLWVVLLLILAQIRSARWAGATLRRLEVI